MIGGAGNDTFFFDTRAHAGNGGTRDFIADFAAGDKVNIATFDANTVAGGTQHFLWDGQTIADHVRGHAGYYQTQDVTLNWHTVIEGNTSLGGLAHDFQIDMLGQFILTIGTDVII